MALTTGAAMTLMQNRLNVMYGIYLDSDWELYGRYTDSDGSTANTLDGSVVSQLV